METRPRCYVASPLGFSEAGRAYYAGTYLPALATVVEPVDPWGLVAPAEVASAQAAGRDREIALRIGMQNIEAIRSCSMLVAYLEGQEPDAGTVAELGYGAGLGLTCFGLRSDLREAGEPGVAVNLQVEAFVAASGGVIARSLEELVEVLRRAIAAASALV